jgi:CO dehydrogenase maturation factor
MKIAVSGKGGAGKTTLVSLMAQGYRDRGFKVFAIDADSDANLALNLGIAPDTQITPLTEMHELIKERTGAAPGAPTVFYTLNPRVDDIPDRFSLIHNGIRVMNMGSLRRGGSGCACPEHVLVKEILRHLLVERDEVVLLDTSAGIEHLSRGTAQYVDLLLVVVQATAASMQTFQRIKAMAADLEIGTVCAVANRVRQSADCDRIRSETGAHIIGIIPESSLLLDYRGTAVDSVIRHAVEDLLDTIKKVPDTNEAARLHHRYDTPFAKG